MSQQQQQQSSSANNNDENKDARAQQRKLELEEWKRARAQKHAQQMQKHERFVVPFRTSSSNVASSSSSSSSSSAKPFHIQSLHSTRDAAHSVKQIPAKNTLGLAKPLNKTASISSHPSITKPSRSGLQKNVKTIATSSGLEKNVIKKPTTITSGLVRVGSTSMFDSSTLDSSNPTLDSSSSTSMDTSITQTIPISLPSHPQLDLSIARLWFKCTRLFLVNTNAPVNVIVLDTAGSPISSFSLTFPTFDLFSVHDALHAAQNNNYTVARSIFEIIASSPYNPTQKSRTHTRMQKWIIREKSPALCARFWIAWAHMEVDAGDPVAALAVIERGERSVLSVTDIALLQSEYHILLLRHGSNTAIKSEFDNDMFDIPEPPTITDIDTTAQIKMEPADMDPIMRLDRAMQAHSLKPTSSQLTSHPTHAATFASWRSSSSTTPRKAPPTGPATPLRPMRSAFDHPGPFPVETVADMLSTLSISTNASTPTKTVPPNAQSLASKAVRAKTLLAGSDQQLQGAVTMLTPIRARKKDRELLGVDKVLTPVRRSMRNIDTDDAPTTPPEVPAIAPSAALSTTAKKQGQIRMSQMMEDYGYNFVPNHALLGDQRIPVTATPTKRGQTPARLRHPSQPEPPLDTVFDDTSDE